MSNSKFLDRRLSAKVEILKGRFLRFMRRFSADESGPTAVEYAVMLALILITVLISVQAIGVEANGKFKDIAKAMKVK